MVQDNSDFVSWETYFWFVSFLQRKRIMGVGTKRYNLYERLHHNINFNGSLIDIIMNEYIRNCILYGNRRLNIQGLLKKDARFSKMKNMHIFSDDGIGKIKNIDFKYLSIFGRLLWKILYIILKVQAGGPHN